ncbi:MAG: hypothetical protein K2X93_15475, partial [Candidatus Obscuribacterales bacterium]|nr:hypothetical protein [Candidatus Obscuribacterales bacterium]
MRNPMDANEVRNRQHFPKNNLFCYRWRVLDNFNKSNDRQAFHLSHQTADNHFSLMSDKFLQLYKSRLTSSRNDLIVDLAQDAIKFLNRRKHEHFELTKVEVMLSKAVQELMERVFNTLLSFSTELNSVLGLSELFIAATEPEIKKRSNSSEASIALYIQAHLSTSLFRLVMEGRHDHICFYLIPADNIMAIQDLARQYEPVAAWKAQFAS